ncbi:MAG: cytochrome c biogenesis protein CcsA [Planctomycetota bacterium]|jgi:ABC-type transport system involved in cytochrome c biogenesis permease subunit
MEKVSVVCFLSSYLLAVGFSLLRLRGKPALSRVFTLAATAAGFIAQTIYLWVRARNADLPPLLVSVHDWLLVLAWIGVLIFLFVSLLDRDLPLGIFVLPVVLVLVVASRFVEIDPLEGHAKAELAAESARGWVMLHTSFLSLGIVGVIGSMILAAMYLLQHRRLKHKQRISEGVQLPNLARLERWNRWAVILCVPMLTLGMAAGVLLTAQSGAASVSITDPVIAGSVVGWLVMFSFFAWMLGTKRPAARQVAMLTVWACSFLLLTVVGLMVLTGSGHQVSVI